MNLSRHYRKLTRLVEPTERQSQCAFIEWAGYAQRERPELAMLFAVPNGGDRHRVVAAKLRAEGVRAGVPDLCLPIGRGGFLGLWLELKRRGSGQTSREQRHWLEALAGYGHCTAIVWSSEQAQAAVCAYLDGRLDAREIRCPLDMAKSKVVA